MLRTGRATKVTVHLNEDTVAKRDYLYRDLFAFLLERGVAGATLLRPEAGFGAHQRIHSTHPAGAREEGHLPVRIEFIESPEKVEALLPDLCAMVSDGLIEAQETTIWKWVAGGER